MQGKTHVYGTENGKNNDMSIVKNELAKRDRTIFAQGNTITALSKDNAALQKEVAELRRQLQSK